MPTPTPLEQILADLRELDIKFSTWAKDEEFTAAKIACSEELRKVIRKYESD